MAWVENGFVDDPLPPPPTTITSHHFKTNKKQVMLPVAPFLRPCWTVYWHWVTRWKQTIMKKWRIGFTCLSYSFFSSFLFANSVFWAIIRLGIGRHWTLRIGQEQTRLCTFVRSANRSAWAPKAIWCHLLFMSDVRPGRICRQHRQSTLPHSAWRWYIYCGHGYQHFKL